MKENDRLLNELFDWPNRLPDRVMANKNYENHLYFEPYSKEYMLNRCIKILGMIAKLKDRNERLINFCEKIYGVSENGLIKSDNKRAYQYEKNKKTIRRLKSYYNNLISRLDRF